MTRVHVITGSFGAGKTTAIRRLMSTKPPQELWVVILNEFTDAGIDALSVAQSANGSFDVRLVAGGCLCCVGELEFGKQLRDILRNFKPSRLLIEPSGAGHAADIVDVLTDYETQKALSLDSIICLVDAQDAIRILGRRDENEWAQIQSCDALLLSKPDLAGPAEREAFAQIAAAQYPSKAYLGIASQGELPAESFQHFARGPRFSLLQAPTASTSTSITFDILHREGKETTLQALNLHAVQWQLPHELIFSRVILERRLEWMLGAYGSWLRRMKAVFRTGPGPSWLMQSAGHGLSIEDSAYRRDSRLELVLNAAPTEEFLEAWRGVLRDAANP